MKSFIILIVSWFTLVTVNAGVLNDQSVSVAENNMKLGGCKGLADCHLDPQVDCPETKRLATNGECTICACRPAAAKSVDESYFDLANDLAEIDDIASGISKQALQEGEGSGDGSDGSSDGSTEVDNNNDDDDDSTGPGQTSAQKSTPENGAAMTSSVSTALLLISCLMYCLV
ncbi:uncharacterized protein LOC141914265 [Tubulanus polymorphus]|uniref:uncharacterized protein LOC141914265 n=1 Tax=Tubulanus polymorphus TaxID=672921 RepID=UPI003DA4D647